MSASESKHMYVWRLTSDTDTFISSPHPSCDISIHETHNQLINYSEQSMVSMVKYIKLSMCRIIIAVSASLEIGIRVWYWATEWDRIKYLNHICRVKKHPCPVQIGKIWYFSHIFPTFFLLFRIFSVTKIRSRRLYFIIWMKTNSFLFNFFPFNSKKNISNIENNNNNIIIQ